MSVKCDLYAVRCTFYFFQMSVYVCVPRPKDTCPSTEGHMSLDRRTQTYMSSIKRVKPRL